MGMAHARYVTVSRPVSATIPIPSRRGRVLVVDDEPFVANAIAIFISDEHEVTVETSAATALERLRTGESFDVIVCDMMMPGVSGMDFHDELVSRGDPHHERIVFITGGAYTSRARSFLDAVSNECIDKPPDPLALRALIARRVHEAHVSREAADEVGVFK